jgi:ATP-dependent Clp protease ATP-binding subunit ClpA
MFERYTERARRTIFVARYEAAELGAQEIDNEHLLLGLIRESHHLLRYLPDLDYIDMLRNEVLATAPPRAINPSPNIPMAAAAKRCLAYAAEEAEALGHQNVGTEHLFLALLREPESSVAKICMKFGAELDKARQLLIASDFEAATQPARLRSSGNKEPEGCVVFVEANSGERVGITGLQSIAKVPREGEFVTLDDYRGTQRRFRVVEVTHHFHRDPPQAVASAHQLCSITIRVLQIAPHASADVDST